MTKMTEERRTEQLPPIDPAVEVLRRPAGHVFLSAVAELWSLFVDDGALAFALVLWCGCATWGLPRLGTESAIRAPLLLIGCVLILVVDVLGTAFRWRSKLK